MLRSQKPIEYDFHRMNKQKIAHKKQQHHHHWTGLFDAKPISRTTKKINAIENSKRLWFSILFLHSNFMPFFFLLFLSLYLKRVHLRFSGFYLYLNCFDGIVWLKKEFVEMPIGNRLWIRNDSCFSTVFFLLSIDSAFSERSFWTVVLFLFKAF